MDGESMNVGTLAEKPISADGKNRLETKCFKLLNNNNGSTWCTCSNGGEYCELDKKLESQRIF